MHRWTNARSLPRILLALLALGAALAYMYVQDRQDDARATAFKAEAREATDAAAAWRKEHGSLPKPNSTKAPKLLQQDITIFAPGTEYDTDHLPTHDGLGWVARGQGGFTVLAIQHKRKRLTDESDRAMGFSRVRHSWTICPYNRVDGAVTGGKCRTMSREVRGKR